MNVPELVVDAGARTRGDRSIPTDVVALADGTRLRLRAIEIDDRDRIAALFARLSPQSRYRRFLSPKLKLTPRELSQLTDIDHIHHVAIAAVDDRDGSIVGVAGTRKARAKGEPRN